MADTKQSHNYRLLDDDNKTYKPNQIRSRRLSFGLQTQLEQELIVGMDNLYSSMKQDIEIRKTNIQIHDSTTSTLYHDMIKHFYTTKRNICATLLLLFTGIGLLTFGVFSWIEAEIPLNSSYSLLLLFSSSCFVIAGLWKLLQIIYIHTCFGSNYNQKHNQNQCMLSPGFAILFIFSSISSATLSLFGFWTYPTTISYPFWLSLLYAFLSFIFLSIATFGFYGHCSCCDRIVKIWKKISFYVIISFVIWDIISDILAAIKVYRHNDPKFFTISITFSCITFILYYAMGFTQRHDDETYKKKFWRTTLYIPIVSMMTVTVHNPGSNLIALCFSSFPQYVISLSFILEHGITNIYNVSALLISLFQLLSSPFFTISLLAWKEMAEERLSARIGANFMMLIAYLFFFLPVLLLEIIHFCPILFEYYLYDGIEYKDVVVYLLFFNIPKFLFIFLKFPNTDDDSTTSAPEVAMNEIKDFFEERDQLTVTAQVNKSMVAIMYAIVYSLCFLVLPLIPAALGSIMFVTMVFITLTDIAKEDKQKQEEKLREANVFSKMTRCNVFVMLIYLLIAYGGMGRMLFTVDGGVGQITFWMLMVTWILAIWLVLSPILIPFLMWMMFKIASLFGVAGEDNEADKEMMKEFSKGIKHTLTLLLCCKKPVFVNNKEELFRL